MARQLSLAFQISNTVKSANQWFYQCMCQQLTLFKHEGGSRWLDFVQETCTSPAPQNMVDNLVDPKTLALVRPIPTCIRQRCNHWVAPLAAEL